MILGVGFDRPRPPGLKMVLSSGHAIVLRCEYRIHSILTIENARRPVPSLSAEQPLITRVIVQILKCRRLANYQRRITGRESLAEPLQGHAGLAELIVYHGCVEQQVLVGLPGA